jgi:hypothetical protein
MNSSVRLNGITCDHGNALSPENSFTTGFTFDLTGGRATY